MNTAQPAPRSGRRRWLFRAGALVAGLLAAYVLLELAGGVLLLLEQTSLVNATMQTRRDVHGQAVRDRNGLRLPPQQVWRDENGISYRSNNLGFRGDTVELNALRGDTRTVIGIGDSCMYGAGVAQEQTFTACLQRELGDTPPVLNAGISGTGYEEYLPQLLYVLDDLGLRPRAVMVMLCANDIGDFPYSYPEFAYPRAGLLNILPVRLVKWWRGWSLWYRGFVVPHWDPLAVSLGTRYACEGSMPARLRQMRVAQTYRMLDAVKHMDELCRARGTKVLAFVLPSGYQYEPTGLHDNLVDAEYLAGQMNVAVRVPFLDQERQGRLHERRWLLDSVHPSGEFHRAMAQAAARWLRGEER